MTQPNKNDIAKATNLYSTYDGQKLIDAIAQALADERDATWDAAIEEERAKGRAIGRQDAMNEEQIRRATAEKILDYCDMNDDYNTAGIMDIIKSQLGPFDSSKIRL